MTKPKLQPQWFLGRNDSDSLAFDHYNHINALEELSWLANCSEDENEVLAQFLASSENSFRRLADISKSADRYSSEYFDNLNRFLLVAIERCDGVQFPPDAMVLFLWDASREYGNFIIHQMPIELAWSVFNGCPDPTQTKLIFDIQFNESVHLKPFSELYGNTKSLLGGDEEISLNYFRSTENFLRGYAE